MKNLEITLLLMTANSAIQSSTRKHITMLFCSKSPQPCLIPSSSFSNWRQFLVIDRENSVIFELKKKKKARRVVVLVVHYIQSAIFQVCVADSPLTLHKICTDVGTKHLFVLKSNYI